MAKSPAKEQAMPRSHRLILVHLAMKSEQNAVVCSIMILFHSSGTNALSAYPLQ